MAWWDFLECQGCGNSDCEVCKMHNYTNDDNDNID